MSLSTLRIAWRNLGRNKRRTALAVLAIALGQCLLVFVNGLMSGSFNQMVATMTGPLVGHVQIHHAEWREERAVDLYIGKLAETRDAILSIDGVQSVSPRIYTAALTASGEKTDEPATAEPGMIVGIDIATESAKGGMLETLTPEQLPKKGVVVLGQVLARRLGVEAGQLLAVIGQDADGFPNSDLFTISTVIKSNIDIIHRMGVLMSLEDAGAFLAMPDEAHELIVHGDDYLQAEALAESIRALPSLEGAQVLPWREAMPELTRLIDLKDWSDYVFLAIVFIAAAAGIANTTVMSTFERLREFGMLLSIGTRPWRLVRMVLIESVIIGIMGVIIGSAVGTAIVLITNYTGIDYAALGGAQAESISFAGMSLSYVIHPEFSFRHILLGFYAVTITSLLASLFPAMSAARLEPVEALNS